jgi:hypothetical protein
MPVFRRCRERTLQNRRLTSEHYEKAGELIERYGASDGLRTLDSLQFAVALDLYRCGAVEDLVAADKVICKVAAVEGMPVSIRNSRPCR